MSGGDVLVSGDAPEAATGAGPGHDRGGTWTLTRGGVATVLRLELRQRVRATRWVVVLAVWSGLLGLLTGLLWMAFGPLSGSGGSPDEDTGAMMFGIIVFLVLSLGSLVAPAMSATSVNGDRNAGVLATLQTTLLTPAEIAVGKLLAAWTTAIALLVAAAPWLVIAFLMGGTPFERLLVVLVVLALTLGVVCAIGLGWSAVTARTSSSAVLTYLTVALLGLGLPLLFALSLPFVTTEDTITVRQFEYDANGNSGRCETTTQTLDRTHTEVSWWLLAASPYVVVSDAAPRPTGQVRADDPLSAIREGVRELRLGPPDTENWCSDSSPGPDRQAERDELGPTWPYGLAIDLALAAGFLVLTVRRLRTPATRLPRGTRVA
jgi:ABC-type transport system involved in multi-copper enzyme maturation permease subunit